MTTATKKRKNASKLKDNAKMGKFWWEWLAVFRWGKREEKFYSDKNKATVSNWRGGGIDTWIGNHSTGK